MKTNKFKLLAFIGLLAISYQFVEYQRNSPELLVEDFADIAEKMPSIASEIGTADDAFARFNYLTRLQIDPETGVIPFGIYQRELEFTSKIGSVEETGNSNLRTRQNEWGLIGPNNVGGRTRAFGIDVTDNNILIAGSVSGSMWRSENAGQSWEITSNTSNLVGATVAHQDRRPGRENIWYYGTGEIRGNSQRAPGAAYRGDGIFKSEDGGRSWFPLTSTQVPVLSFFNSQFNYVFNIIVNHTRLDKDEVYAATYGGILRSQDGGDSWSVTLGDELFGLDPEEDLNGANSPFFTEIELSEEGIFYGYLSELTSSGYNPIKRGVFRSTDGLDWTDITPDNLPDSANRAVMAIAPTDEDIMYMFVHHGDRETEEKAEQSLWKYTHQEPVGSWENLSANIPNYGGEVGDMDTQNSYNMVIEVHPNDEDIVYLGGTNLYRSLDGFRSQDNHEWIGGYDTINDASQRAQHHADQHGLYFHKELPFRLYSIHDAGISFTEASTVPYPIWRSISEGYHTSQFFAIDIQMDGSSDLVIGGAQDNGSWFVISNSLSNWVRTLGGDGAFSAVSEQARFLYASAQQGRVFRIIPDFEERALVSFSRVDPVGAGEKEGQKYLFINPFILDPNETDRMFIAGGDAIWRNQNLSQIPAGTREKQVDGWDKLENTVLPDSVQVSALAASVNISNRLYYGTTNGSLFRIDNAHLGEGELSEISGIDFPDEGNIMCIAVNPENAEEFMVVFSNYNVPSIFLTTNGGVNFEQIGGNLEQYENGVGDGPSVRWGAIVPMANGINKYYAGTSSGLFSTIGSNGMETEWLREGSSTLGRSIVTMIKYRPLDGRIVVATHGNGVFSSDVTGFKPLTPPKSEEGPFKITTTYPNPFREKITVEYSLPEEHIVLARIYDLKGNWVKTALWGTQLAGSHSITWNGTNNSGQLVPEGIYILNLMANGKLTSSKLILSR